MEYDDDTRTFNFLAGLAVGAALGASIALLTAPHSGRRTRRRIKRLAGDVREGARDRWDELADDVKGKVDDAFDGARKRFAR